MLFPKRQTILSNFQGTIGLGSSATIEITRDFFLDSLFVQIPVTYSLTNADLTSGGLYNVVKQLTLNVADGQSNRNCIQVSGFGAMRFAGQVLNGLDRQSLMGNPAFMAASTVTPSVGTLILSYPILFKHPQISDPIGSAFMLPLPRYNANPILTVQFGALTDVTSNGADTITFGKPYVVCNKRQVDNISFPTWQMELIENQVVYGATGANQAYYLQVPGSYASFDIFTQTAAGVAGDISGGIPYILQYLGNTLRQFTYGAIRNEENYSQGNDGNYNLSPGVLGDYWPGNLHLDFLHDGFGMEVGELGSVLNTNLLAGSGSQVQLLSNIASTGTASYMWYRIFGDLTPLKLSTQVSAN